MKKAQGLLPFVKPEKQALQGLAMVVGFRMLGLFMLLPVLALYAGEFSGSSPALIGLAIGVYGLTQAALQIPFGMVSDYLGRKKVIIAGLLLFALGSVVAAVADTIYALIAGRALQGAGAISAVSMALLADLTREEVRVRAMAVLGITIGFSFMLAIILGPLVASWVGVSGLFWFTAVLAIVAIAVVVYRVPRPHVNKTHRDAQTVPAQLGAVLKDRQLLRLDFGIFTLHMVLTAVFVAVPYLLQTELGIPGERHGWVYFGVMLSSVLFMLPMVILAEAKQKMKPVFVGAVLVLVVAQLALYWGSDNFLGMVVGLIIFFSAFNVLESVLPSLISKTAPIRAKGTAMGVYSSGQFFGAFVGGVLGGWVIESTGDYRTVFLLAAAVLMLWLFLAFSMQRPNSLGTMLLKVGTMDAQAAEQLASQLAKVVGVQESVVVAEEGVAFVRIDNDTVDRAALWAYSENIQGEK